MIACLGWGSLIWDRRDLPIDGEWFKNGPVVPVEFSRQSDDGRVTLVIDPNASPIPVLWARMQGNDIDAARRALKTREGITARRWERRIPLWERGQPAPDGIPELPNWAESIGANAVIWTGLGPKFNNQDRRPTVEEVVGHLSALQGQPRVIAERYVRSAPTQIVTPYRSEIETRLGWTPHTTQP